MKNVESENGEILHSTFFILHLKCSGFQPQTSPFVKTKHQVHVLYGLTHGTFEEVVYHRSDNSLVAKFVDVDESFVCVHHLLEVERLVDVVREGSILVEVLVECSQLLCRRIGGRTFLTIKRDDFCAEDATRKITTIRNEIHRVASALFFPW